MTDVAVSRLDRLAWPRSTNRLTLRPATTADAQATWAFRRLDRVSHWLTRAPRSFDEYRTQFDDPASLAKTLIIELEGVVIGDLMIAVEDAWAQGEVADDARNVQADLGWVLHLDYTGRGYATQAVHEVLRICFQDLGLRRVTANCFAENDASWHLMERLGMRREGHAIREITAPIRTVARHAHLRPAR